MTQTGAIVGNDDAGTQAHAAYGFNNAWSTNPQISADLIAGQQYTLVASTYRPSDHISLPFTFYTDRTGAFAGYTVPASNLSFYYPAVELNHLFFAKRSLMINQLDDDCETSDSNQICLKMGSQFFYFDKNSEKINTTIGSLIGSYQFNPKIRIGGFIDKSLYKNYNHSALNIDVIQWLDYLLQLLIINLID